MILFKTVGPIVARRNYLFKNKKLKKSILAIICVQKYCLKYIWKDCAFDATTYHKEEKNN